MKTRNLETMEGKAGACPRSRILEVLRLAAFAVFFAILLALPSAAVYGAEAPDVQKHSREEVKAYLENAEKNGITLDSALTFSEKPVVTAPYAPGKLSEDTQNKALCMLNLIRYIAGLNDNVVYDASYGELAQAGTLVNYVNHQMTHYPERPSDMGEELYNKGYTGCGQSNISWSSAENASLANTIVNGWMADDDDSNISKVGHRRWCLNPKMAKTAFGAVSGENGTYGAMYSFDSSGDLSASTVVWPAQTMPLEYFNLSYPWSISSGETFPANSTVTLTRKRGDVADKVWSFSSSSADGYFHHNTNYIGYGNCLIFRPSGMGSIQDGDIYLVQVKSADTILLEYTVDFFAMKTMDKGARAYFHTEETVAPEGSGVMEALVIEGEIPASSIGLEIEDESIATAAVADYGNNRMYVNITGRKMGTTRVTVFLPNGNRSTVTVRVISSDHQHNYVEYGGQDAKVLKEATCTEQGFRAWHLCECGAYSGYYIIPKKAHTKKVIPGTPASCETAGTSDGAVCTVCGEVLAEQTTLSPLGHAYSEKVVAPTCLEDGYTIHTCSRCDDSYTDSYVAKTGHNYGKWTSAGQNGHRRICQNDSSHVEMEEHSWDLGTQTKPPSCTEGGTVTYTCNVCGETRTETRPVTAHTPTVIPAVPATCTEQGRTEGSKCSVCGVILSEGEVLPALGHDFGPWISDGEEHHIRTCSRDKSHVETGHHAFDEGAITKEATCTEKGEKTFTCQLCTMTAIEEIDLLPHTPIVTKEEEPATCENPGKTAEVRCQSCGLLLHGQEEIQALGHRWDEGIVTKEATCTEKGEKTFTCRQCTMTTIEEIDLLPHTPIVTKEEQSATCENPGKTAEVRCQSCGLLLLAQEEIQALGHRWDEGIVTRKATLDAEGEKLYTCAICGSERREPYSLTAEERQAEEQKKKEEEEAKARAQKQIEDRKKANQVANAISSLPGTDKLRLADQKSVASAAKAYTNLTNDQKKLVSSALVKKLNNAKKLMEELKKEAAAEEKAGHITIEALTKKMAALPDTSDPENSTYASLAAKASKTSSSSLTLQWKKMSDADGYIVFANKCGKSNAYKLAAEIKDGSKNSFVLKKCGGKALTKNTYYKAVVVAYKVTKGGEKRMIAISKSIHAATLGGKNGNPTALTAKTSLTVKVKKTAKLQITQKTASGKVIAKHLPLRFESSNTKIATVTKDGVVKGKKAGKCIIYVYAQNGLTLKVTVTVK